MKAIMPIKLTAKERKALEDEVNRQTAENVKKLSVNLQALVLWNLHEQLGFGKKRLLKFQKAFRPMIEELQKYYEVNSADDTEFILKRRLEQEVGIDVEELESMFKFEVRVNKGDKR